MTSPLEQRLAVVLAGDLSLDLEWLPNPGELHSPILHGRPARCSCSGTVFWRIARHRTRNKILYVCIACLKQWDAERQTE